MADENDSDAEKTEEPSQYRIDEARKKGDVASSKELSSILLLSGSLLTLILCGFYIYEVFTEYIEYVYKIDWKLAYEKEKFSEIFRQTAWALVKCVAPSFGASLCLGVFSQFVQVGFLYSPEILTADIERLNPVKGFSKLFSKKAIVEAVKGVFKFIVVIVITVAANAYMLKREIQA